MVAKHERLLARWSDARAEFERLVDLDEDTRAGQLRDLARADAELAELVARLIAGDGGTHDGGTHDGGAHDGATATRDVPMAARLGAFRLLEPIGSGGMGTVWEAEQDSPRRRVALKVLHASLTRGAARARFEAEADILAHLRHPNIAQVHASGVERIAGGVELCWIALERVPAARDLAAWVAGERPTLARRLALFLELCDALQHAHERGVIHRDLKASNVLVDASGAPKVIDFGIARRLAADAEPTRAGELWGSLVSMAPEQLAGDEPAGVRTDVYALGALLYFLVAGVPPIVLDGATPEEALRRVREEPPLPLRTRAPHAPRELDWIARRALEKAPSRRYASAAELAADVRRHLAGDAVVAAPRSASYAALCWARRHSRALAVVSLVALVAAAGLFATADARAGRRAAARLAADSAAEADLEAVARARLVSLFEFAIATARRETGGGELDVLDVLERLEPTIDQTHGVDADSAIHLRGALVRLWAAAGAYERARDLAERNLAALDAAGQRETARGAECLRDLGHVRGMLGDLDGARAALREAERLAGGRELADPIASYETLVQLGIAASASGHVREARDHYLEAERIAEAAGVDRLSRYDVEISALAARSQCGEMAAVDARVRELESEVAERLGPEHALAADTRLLRVQVAFDLGRRDEAREGIDALEPLARSLWPAGTPRASRFDLALARVRYETGERDAALALGRDTAASLERHFGPAHPFVARATALVAWMEDELGESADARARIARIAAARAEVAASPNDPARIELETVLARIDQRAGDPTAPARLAAAAELQRELLGPAAPRVARIEAWLAGTTP